MSITRRDFLAGTLAGAGLTTLGCQTPLALSSGSGGSVSLEFMQPPGMEDLAMADPTSAAAELFGANADIARKVLARALRSGGDFAEIFFEQHEHDVLKLEEGRVDVTSARVERGAGVRVVVGDGTGYAYTESLREEDLIATAATAAMIARVSGGPPEDSAFRAVELPSRYEVRWSPTDYAIADKMALLRRVDEAARAASDEVRVVVAWHVNGRRRTLLYRSDGLVVADDQPRTDLGCLVSVQRGERTERNSYAEGGRWDQRYFTKSDRPEAIAKEAVHRATVSLEAVVPPAGEMPVVLAPGSAGVLLHEAVGHGLEADFNRKKLSIYAGRIGERVASELCTVVDDGTLPNSQGSITVDDEGTPSARNVLIEKGILRGYLHDRISAKHFGVKPTGNGRRESYRFPPVPRMTNTFLLDGPHEKEEVFAGIARGIYAISFPNGQVNIGAGDYTFFVGYGYLIEDGKLTSPIKDVNIIGNGPESLRRIDRVAGDLEIPNSGSGHCGKAGQRVPVNFGLPHVRIAKATVGGRA